MRWRRVDLQVLIEARFGVRLHERTVGKVLRRLGFTRLSVRPRHPKADEAAQEAFKKVAHRVPLDPRRMKPRLGWGRYRHRGWFVLGAASPQKS